MTELHGYEVHPMADRFPLIEGDEFDELVKSIGDRGLAESIVLSSDGDVLIDGRNRLRACIAARVDPHFVKLSPRDSEVDYIAERNMRRRDLTPSQRAVLALDILEAKEEEARQRQLAAASRGRFTQSGMGCGTGATTHPTQSDESDKARDAAAKVAGASGRAVGQAKRVAEHAPDLLDDVRSGTLPLKEAEREAAKRQKAKAQPSADPKPKPTPQTVDLIRPDGTTVPYPKPKAARFNKTDSEGISWANWSWNPITGCDHGCTYCYARDLATSKRYEASYPVGFDPIYHPERLDAPANTRPGADGDGRVFVCSMADMFGRWVPDQWIDEILTACHQSPEWTYIFLTKFPSRYAGIEFPDGAWVGTSIDTQRRADLVQNVQQSMAAVKASVRWLSVEPLLEPVQFDDLSMFDWVVIGAQTAANGEPPIAPEFEWVADIVRIARRDGCAVHLKPNLKAAPGMKMPDEYPK